MAALRDKSGISARALEFTTLTAARTGEAIGARWSEFDLLAKLWIVPPQRTKAGKEHRVALSDRAVQILSGLPRTGDFVFRAANSDRPISSSAMLDLVRGMRGMGATVHGFRSTFRDWAAEQTAYPTELCEMALAHAVGNESRDRLQARRHAGKAPPADGGLGGLLRAGAGGARQRGSHPGARVMPIALYDPMLETYWTLRQALAWATRRDANDVRECVVVSGDFGGWPRKIGGKAELELEWGAFRQRAHAEAAELAKRGMSIVTQAKTTLLRPPLSEHAAELARRIDPDLLGNAQVHVCGVEPGDEERCGIVESNLNLGQTLNQAFTALREAIESGALAVNGIVTADGKRRDLTPMECLDLHFEWRLALASFATARVATPHIEPAIRDLRVCQIDVLRIFPENVAVENVETKADRPGNDEASTGAPGRLRRVRPGELEQFLATPPIGRRPSPRSRRRRRPTFRERPSRAALSIRRGRRCPQTKSASKERRTRHSAFAQNQRDNIAR